MKTLVMELHLPFENSNVALIEGYAAAAGQTPDDFMTELCGTHVESILLLLMRDLKRMGGQVN